MLGSKCELLVRIDAGLGFAEDFDAEPLGDRRQIDVLVACLHDENELRVRRLDGLSKLDLIAEGC